MEEPPPLHLSQKTGAADGLAWKANDSPKIVTQWGDGSAGIGLMPQSSSVLQPFTPVTRLPPAHPLCLQDPARGPPSSALLSTLTSDFSPGPPQTPQLCSRPTLGLEGLSCPEAETQWGAGTAQCPQVTHFTNATLHSCAAGHI